ncbi:MAG: DNA-deoxyinosine glycosylase [Geminicoccaceae bacterium]
MSYVHSFPPIESAISRVLILGTMPGMVSLRERQYYAHPQNAFWRIAGTILGFDPASPYEVRVALMRAAGIAVWDVLKSCTRQGSLDSDIVHSTAVPNDLPAFLCEHPQIRRICFNGAKAEALYARHVRPRLAASPDVQYMRLPSTSPANASVPWSEKLQAWRAIAR